MIEEFEEIKSRVAECGKMEPALKLKECKALQARLEGATMHIAGREELTAMLKKVRKDLIAYEKEVMKEKQAKALKDVAELIPKIRSGVEKSVVLKFAGDKSVVNDVCTEFEKQLPDVAVFAMGVDEGNDQLVVITVVPAAMQETLPANDWCNAGVSAADGKGGGKPGRAQGNAKGIKGGVRVCEAAAEFASAKLA